MTADAEAQFRNLATRDDELRLDRTFEAPRARLAPMGEPRSHDPLVGS